MFISIFCTLSNHNVLNMVNQPFIFWIMFNHNVLPRCKLASKESARLPQFQFQLFLQKMKCWKWFDWSECCPANLNVNSNQYLQKLRSVHPPPITVILSSSSSGDRRCMGSKPDIGLWSRVSQKKASAPLTIWHHVQFDTADNLTLCPVSYCPRCQIVLVSHCPRTTWPSWFITVMNAGQNFSLLMGVTDVFLCYWWVLRDAFTST